MKVIGTGLRTQSSIGDVFSTYLHNSSISSRDASESIFIFIRIFEYPGRMVSDNQRNACKFKSPSISKLRDFTLIPRAAELYTTPTDKQEPIACSNDSTAFGPLFSPSRTGGSSPTNIKGVSRLSSSVLAPVKL